jgi:multidrug efflux pump subunit AcrB
MVILFRSLLVSFVILVVLPLAVICAFVALAVTGHVLSTQGRRGGSTQSSTTTTIQGLLLRAVWQF